MHFHEAVEHLVRKGVLSAYLPSSCCVEKVFDTTGEIPCAGIPAS